MKHSLTNIAIINLSCLSNSQEDRCGHTYFRDAPRVSPDRALIRTELSVS